MRKEILFFILFFSLSIVNASDLGIYPDELNFNGDIGEKICKEAIVFSSERISIELEDYWAEGEAGREVAKYYQKSEFKGIEISYPERFYFKDKKEVKVCITGNIAGKFNGLLMFRGENVGIGTWIKVNIHRSVLSKITGNTIYDLGEGNMIGMMLFFTFILLMILGYLLFRTKKYPN